MPAGFDPDEAWERGYLLERAAWLVRLRWFAVTGIAFAVAAAYVTKFVPRPAPILMLGIAFAACNAFWEIRVRRVRQTASLRELRAPIFQQLLGDMIALALMIHFSGGAENPFQMVFAFPVAIGAMLLGRRQAIALAAIGGGVHVALVLGQFTELLSHHGLHGPEAQIRIVDPLYRSLRYLAGYLLAFTIMLAGVTYLVGAVTSRYRKSEALRRDHERVMQSRERLVRIGEISAGVAHSLRNPVHGLLGSVELLHDRLRGEPQAEETLELMTEALTRIEAVTRRLLSLTHDVPLRRTSCDVDSVVASTIRGISPASRESQASLTTEVGDVGYASIDPLRISEALSNLVDNALDACRDGGNVVVRTFAEQEPGDEIVIEVSDNGCGIPDEHLKKVFDPFFTTKAVGEGSGLGLALTRTIAEEHGGKLTLASSVSSGTSVRLTLPREAPVRTAGAE